MNTATTIRELSLDEISLVGGSGELSYYEELFTVMLAGGVMGALAAGATTAGVGAPAGFVSGALLAGTSYATKEFIEWVILTYWSN